MHQCKARTLSRSLDERLMHKENKNCIFIQTTVYAKRGTEPRSVPRQDIPGCVLKRHVLYLFHAHLKAVSVHCYYINTGSSECV